MEQKAISSDLIRGHIDTIILHTLISGDKHAQQISDYIDLKSDKKYQINQATLYSSLKRLESLKKVKSYWFDSDDGRRKFFCLTDSGRSSVEENLSSWAYSRAIIDKLMDCEPQPIYKTQYIEKIVEAKVPDSNNVSPVLTQNTVNLETKIDENKSNIPLKDTETELNFRNILNGLIKSSTIKHTNEDIETVCDNNAVNEEKIEKFNEKLDNSSNIEKTFRAGKIDLSELSQKASNEGYKLRISSKDSFINPGTLLINKLNLITSSIMFFITVALFFLLKANFNSYIHINTVTTLLLLLGFVISPLISAILYYVKPNKTTSKHIGADIILFALILVFNLTLITFALNLIFNVDFTNFKTILISLIYPFIIYLLIMLHFTIKYFISKSKIVKYNTNKKAKTTAN